VPPRSERHRLRNRRQRERLVAALAFLAALAAIASAAGGGAVAATLAVAGTASSVYERCMYASLAPAPLPQNSFVLAADGSPLGSIPTTVNREPVRLGQMSPWLAKAIVAIEDRRFFEHRGLDPEGIARAAVENLRSDRIVQGGSTITQQLVRNLFLADPSPTVRRKLEEACLAVRLEQEWPKAHILGRHLNHVFFGNQAHGAEAAARIYFSKPASELTLTEAALLAGLPQAPSLYDPFRRPEAALARRNAVLTAMLGEGSITEAQHSEAVTEPLGVQRGGSRYQLIREPGFFEWVRRELVLEYGLPAIRSGGLRVRTTLDLRLQQLAYEAILSSLRTPGGPAAAVVAIDPRAGAVRAMAASGAAGQRHNFNLAWQGRRQAGSAFKTFTLVAAVEQGMPLSAHVSGSAVISDRRCLVGHNRPWTVRGGGSGSLGNVIAVSSNRAFANLVTQVGPDSVVRMSHRLGIRSPLRPVCAITLGSESVSPLEMTTAYATLAARGLRRDPQGVELIRTRAGEVLGNLDARGRRAVSADVADTVTQALRGTVSFGTGRAAAVPGFDIAGKTGTTDKFWDAWFCGYTSELATCVWVGYPQGQIPLRNVEGVSVVFGGTIPTRIWHDFMAPALTGAPPQGTVPPRTTTASWLSTEAPAKEAP
jgi:penicillin-binding protein 1A